MIIKPTAQLIWIIFFTILIHSCATKPKNLPTKPTKVITKPKVNSAVVKNTEPEPETFILPEIPREFRAAWIATVANINWPSRNNLSTEQQKNEAIYLLDLLKNNNFNAVIFQARPAADAFYKSDLEPWSYFLTGTTGKAPFPYYDPLEFWIEEAHKRGIEFHVWLNPFRASNGNFKTITTESMVHKMPNEIVKLRNGMYWFDPSEPETQNHVSTIVKDLVQRYDIDGIHFDDYFYPYREYNGGRDFPDDKSWKKYLASGGLMTRADWRRANVNKFVERIYTEIKAQKNHVKFGISPFGIWKSGYPADVVGTSQYDELFADAKLWLNMGWMDYFSPQLYWKEEGPQRFSSLLNWWQTENTKNRHLWPGLNTVAVKNVADKPTEIVNQVNTIREKLNTSKGEIHYSIAGLTNDYRMQTQLKNGPYQNMALVPQTPWLDSIPLVKPNLTFKIENNQVKLNWNSTNSDNIRQWILYKQYGENWEIELLNATDLTKTLDLNRNGKKLNIIALRSIDKLSNESEADCKKIK